MTLVSGRGKKSAVSVQRYGGAYLGHADTESISMMYTVLLGRTQLR